MTKQFRFLTCRESNYAGNLRPGATSSCMERSKTTTIWQLC